ncbi:MAG: response regulator transcription factor, partial [Clostridia bacterium]|nr:response regulator transcription factor [Clostridia bacterium]
AGYEVEEAASGEEALEKFAAEPFDIVLLDIMLPGMSGIDVCRTLRTQSRSLGIIMLSARTQEIDKVGSLMMGADDYITKPFSPSELVARVDALHRRVSMTEVQIAEDLELGEFALNMRTRTLRKGSQQISLTQIEFQMMEYFFSHPSQTLERGVILRDVWGDSYSLYAEEKVVDVNVRRLRIKVEEEPSNPRHLITVWGTGYRWEP